MSIQNKRIALLTEKILRQNLQNGLLPDSKEFTWQLNQALRDSRYDEPSFRFRAYQNTEMASTAKLNESNERIVEDLSVLYQNITLVHQLLNKHYQGFSLEKEKLEKEIDVLENQLRQYIQNANRSGLLPYAYDTFDSTEKTDLAETSHVFVDTTNNAVHLVEEKNTSKRFFPESESRFILAPAQLDKKEEQLTGQLSDIFLEESDKLWQRQVLLRENLALTGTLEIRFAGVQELNRIELDILTVKPVELRVFFTANGDQWYSLPYYESGFQLTKRVALDFPTLSVSGLRFAIEKKESDEALPESDDYDYQYLFGFQSVSFYRKEYPSEGLYVSKALPLLHAPENYAIDAIQLHVDEWTPTGTTIEYEIAVAAADGSKDWQRLDPVQRANPSASQILYFSRLTRDGRDELYFPSEFSIRQSEAEDLLQNGIPLYRLSSSQNGLNQFALPKRRLLENSARLYVGKDSWTLRSFPSTDTASVPMLNDFQQVQDGSETSYERLSTARTGDLFKNRTDAQPRKYLARLAFYLEESRTVSAAPVSTEPLAVYSNGELLFQGINAGSESVTFVFHAGWNEIVLLVNGKNAMTVNGMSVALGFNPNTFTQNIYASSEAMKEISLFDLQYNTKMNDRSVFAKRETENGLEVLVNFGQPGLRFDFQYDYKEEEGLDEETVFFRARLLRENGSNIPTPILRSYRLEFS